MEILKQYRGLPYQIYILLSARIISAIGMFVYPFLTLFLSSRLGFSELAIGKFLLIVSLSYIPAAMAGGKLADRFNRRTTYLVAMASSNIALLAAGFFTDSIIIVYLLIAAFFFMNMSQPVLAAMMMDLTDPGNRQESFSLVYLGVNIGGAIGPAAAGFMFENYIEWIFWGEAILNLLALLLIFVFIKESQPDEEEYNNICSDCTRIAEAPTDDTMFKILLKSPILLSFAACASLVSFGYSQISFILPLQMEGIFGLGPGAKYFGILYSINCIVVVIATPLFVLITKRYNTLLNMSISAVFFMFGLGLYGVAGNLAAFYGLAVVWTLGEILSATNTGVYIANNSPVSHRARFQSIFDIIQGSGRAAGPLIIGYYLINHTFRQAWFIVGLLCFIAALVFFVLYAYRKNSHI